MKSIKEGVWLGGILTGNSIGKPLNRGFGG